MGGYIVNFAVYTMAMIGLIFFALMVYKKCAGFGGISSSNNKLMKVEETIYLAPRKNLYVVKVGDERFLLAGDVDRTSLIAKLDSTNSVEIVPKSELKIKAKADISEQNSMSVTRTSVKNNIDLSKITPEQITNIRKNTGKLSKQSKSSVDDIPVIVDFPNSKGKSEDVLHSMLKKINE